MKQISQTVPTFFFSLFFLLFCCFNSVAQWNSNPTINTTTCTAIDEQSVLKIASDGSGDAIITWEDKTNGNSDIYVQRLNVLDAVHWTADGVAINLIYAF